MTSDLRSMWTGGQNGWAGWVGNLADARIYPSLASAKEALASLNRDDCVIVRFKVIE